jgi:hypothetical protein
MDTPDDRADGRDIAVLLDMWVIFSVTGGGIVALVDLLEEEP